MLLTAGAHRNLAAIYDYLAETEGRARADHVLDQLLEVSDRFAEFPERGGHPKQLLALGIRAYRQLFFQAYRVIYRVLGRQVFITVVADGRRDTQALLARRLPEE